MRQTTTPDTGRHASPRLAAPLSGETFGALINLSGRRRFTSERVVLYAVLASLDHAKAIDKANEALELFLGAHLALVEGSDNLPGMFGNLLPSAYFGSMQGDKQVRDFAELARRTLDASAAKSAQAPALLEQLVQNATPLLATLNQLTQIYEDEAKRHTLTAQRHMTDLMGEIKTISKQARLVAVNAHIVAARAGDGGRDFAAAATELSDITRQMEDCVKQAIKHTTH